MPFIVQRDGVCLGLVQLLHSGDRMRVLVPGTKVAVFRKRSEVDRAIRATTAAAVLVRGSLVDQLESLRPILSGSPFVVIEAETAFGRGRGTIRVDAKPSNQTEIPFDDGDSEARTVVA